MKPKLRHLEFIPIEHKGDDYFLARDRNGFAADVLLPREWSAVLALFDGTRDISEIIGHYSLQYGQTLPHEWIERIIEQLDEALILDSPRFRAHRKEIMREFNESSTRPAMLAGASYPDHPYALKQMVGRFLDEAKTIQVLSPRHHNAKLRGIVVPHIDFNRGGVAEALAYLEMMKYCQSHHDFDTFVILGIAHAGVEYPFCACDKDFETPLGTAKCDREFLADLNARIGDKMLREQYAHKSEHSIEFVTVFLQNIAQFSDVKIVPIICGGFFEELRTGASPLSTPDIAEFVQALREAVQEREARGERIGLIASVDLAHVGSRFGDDEVLTTQRLKEIGKQDLEFLRAIESGDKDAMHDALAKDNNARNVDAHPAVYTLLAAFPELRAQILDYRQAFDAEANSVVSFAAMTLFEIDSS